MKILVINGPNLNMLGIREPDIYGKQSYRSLCSFIREKAREYGVKVDIFQSNSESAIVTKIQRSYRKYYGIVINPAAFTHTSVAILDALKSVGIKTAEVHLSDITAREDFRKYSYVSLYAGKTICGKGFDGYAEAIKYLAEN